MVSGFEGWDTAGPYSSGFEGSGQECSGKTYLMVPFNPQTCIWPGVWARGVGGGCVFALILDGYAQRMSGAACFGAVKPCRSNAVPTSMSPKARGGLGRWSLEFGFCAWRWTPERCKLRKTCSRHCRAKKQQFAQGILFLNMGIAHHDCQRPKSV